MATPRSVHYSRPTAGTIAGGLQLFGGDAKARGQAAGELSVAAELATAVSARGIAAGGIAHGVPLGAAAAAAAAAVAALAHGVPLAGAAAGVVTAAGNLSVGGGTPGPIDGMSINTEVATPEQIGLYLPTTRAVAAGSVAVRYRVSPAGAWQTAHPLLRISTTGNESGGPTTIVDAFAGSIFDLAPGTTYDVELTHTEAGQPVKASTITRTTRVLPAAAGPSNKQAVVGGLALQTLFNGLVPGDVLELAGGTYTVSGLTLSTSGSSGSPIYVRGALKAGVVIRDTTGDVLAISGSHIVIENLTIEGSGSDSGNSSTSCGIHLTGTSTNVTIRGVQLLGVDRGINADQAQTGVLVYDCDLRGNNLWTAANVGTPPDGAAPGPTWNDDGIRLPGFGNCAWNNTLYGFGDSFAVIADERAEGIYYYRNRIGMTGDDAFEGDYATRNIGFYDNVLTNVSILLSLDPLYGGPLYCFRNTCVNTTRGPFKFTTINSGYLVYNNTVVRTDGLTDWGSIVWNNGNQTNYAYRNNLVIWRGASANNVMSNEAGGQSPVDFTNNAWFPNGRFVWTNSGGQWNSLAAAQAGISNTAPLFGSAVKRHTSDVITVNDPFATDIVLGADHLTEYTTEPDATLSAGTTPKNAGVAIPGITDGFSGAAPDIGAVIAGRPVVSVGAPMVFPLSTDASGRFLVQDDGEPFPILGRTLWAIISLDQAAQRAVIDDTAAKGYNTIECAIPHHWNTLSGVPSNQPPYANNGALLPWTLRVDGGAYTGTMGGGSSSPDMTTLNETYWAFVDAFLDYCESRGQLVAFFPCYNGAGGGSDGWMQEMLANGTTRMQTYGQLIGQRYAQRRNILWMLAGDHGSPYNNASEENVMNAFITGLTGVTKVCNHYSAELKQQSTSRSTSTTLLRNTINVNGTYSWIGQCATWARTGYSTENTTPTPIPTFQQEQPFDEEGPDGNGFNGNATQPVRRFWYHGWLGAIGGYIQGNGYVWPFRSTGVSPPTSDSYLNHLNTVATQDAARLNALIKSLEWWRLVPDGLSGIGTLVTAGGGSIDSTNYVAAAATPQRDLLVAYLGPSSGNPTIDMTKLQGTVTARWFDPTNGTYQNVSGQPFQNTGTRQFTKPGNNSAGQGDWVLRLDAPTALPAWIASAALFTWVQLTNTRPTLVGADSTIVAYSGAAYDPTRRYYIFFGGGHNDSADNGVYAVRVGRDVPDVIVLNPKSSSTSDASDYYPDDKPSSRHSYGQNIYCASLDAMMSMGTASPWHSGASGSNTGATNALYLATNTWSPPGQIASFSNSWAGPGGSAAVDSQGRIHVTTYSDTDPARLMMWTPGVPGSWTLLNSNWGGRYGCIRYDSLRNRMVVFDNAPGWYTAGSGTKTNISVFTSFNVSEYCAERDSFFVATGSAGTSCVMREIPAGTYGNGSVVSVAGTAPIFGSGGDGQDGIHNRIHIDTTLGVVFVHCNRANNDVYAFRYK